MATTTKNLQRYRAKRDFTKTGEPSGRKNVLRSQHLRYVIQKHAASHLHYDLRLELHGVFKSWAVAKGPSIDPADKRLAIEVEDHPLDYGDFEGTIPQGEYGGGTVQLWDRGFWAPEGEKPPEQALIDGDLKFALAGERLRGSFVLVRIKNNRGRDTRVNWLLIKHKDAYAKPGGTSSLMAEDRSVASGRSMEAITQGSGKSPQPFMLASVKAATPDAVWHSHRRDTGVPGKRAAKVAAPGDAAAIRPRALAIRPPVLKSAPEFIEPQLCKLVDRPPSQPGWVHEVKLDGYRVQIQVQSRHTKIRTRSGLDWTPKFSAIAQAMRTLPDCIIDGEVVALDAEHTPSFAALQAALSEASTQDLVLYAFDLLIAGKQDLRPLPLSERKAKLQQMLAAKNLSGRVKYVEHIESDGEAVLASACKLGLEGIVSKKLDAAYQSGRSGYWTKTKCRAGHEVVLGGWTTEAGTLRSLLAGVNHDGHLVYVGRIGTGYSSAVISKLLPQLKKLTIDTSPFGGSGAPRKEPNVRWLKPQLVAEIEFAGWTATRMIRQAAFKGLREDKPAADVVAEMPIAPAVSADARLRPTNNRHASTLKTATAATGTPSSTGTGTISIMGVTLSKSAKEFWPRSDAGAPVTKFELAQYYESIGEWLLPHLEGRPCSLLRAPDGINGQQFFQRHAMQGMSNLFSQVKVRGDKEPYVQIDRLAALAAVAQMGGLEIHPWNCGVGVPEVAGRLVFDLDPAPELDFQAVILAAVEIRQRLQDVGLESFCKTTGGKGLHVVTPLTGGRNAVPWSDAKNFAHIICAQMAQDAPAKYLDTMSKAQRKGRIFLDYLRNDRTSTAVAVLSPRARPGAPVSMPLHWTQVRKGLEPGRFTVHTAPEALRKNRPWTEYDAGARPLKAAIARLVKPTKRKSA